jgi:hypothetical protein
MWILIILLRMIRLIKIKWSSFMILLPSRNKVLYREQGVDHVPGGDINVLYRVAEGGAAGVGAREELVDQRVF